MSRNTTLMSLISLCLLLVISGPVYGQNTANLSGTVKDLTGGVLPGVTVTLTEVETGQVRTTITGDEGRYQASSLAVGTYQVAAELVGFQTLVQDGIQLTVGAARVLNAVLSPGNISERVTVTADAALVETTTSSVGDLVNERQIADLPLRMIAAGHAITAVALDVGYESPSAFISMFKSALGTTPTVDTGAPAIASRTRARTRSHIRHPCRAP